MFAGRIPRADKDPHVILHYTPAETELSFGTQTTRVIIPTNALNRGPL